MMTMMEKYSKNLEGIVEERTGQLAEEQKRADQLLYQMMPVSVAEELKAGRTVEPQTFECVTLFFSDISGFEIICSLSTPVQVVNFINTLYSHIDEMLKKYDVYKVETIRDSYMVVSGLPKRNGQMHVTQIVDMALELMRVSSWRSGVLHRARR
jgi:class 3 adenylate cyclase